MKKTLSIIVVVAIVLTFLSTFFFLYKKSQPKATIVQTVSPYNSDIIEKTIATGSVKPRKEIEIKSQVPGIISKIQVREGQIVTTGQIIATIRLTPNLIQVNEAEARLEQAVISLEDAEKTWLREKRDYERVLEDGNLLVDTESPHLIKLRQATADYKTTKLNLEDASKTYQREENLYSKKVTADSRLQEVKYNFDQAVEAHEKAKDLYKIIREETIEAIETAYQKAEIDHKLAIKKLETAQRNLQLIREGSTSDKAEESNTLIRSTITGMVLEIPVKVGSQVTESNPQNSGTTIAVVADMNDMVFTGLIDETEIGKIKTGMKLDLTIGAIEDESFGASIELIAPKGEIVDGTIQFAIEAKVDLKPGHFIRAGYSASADIILDKRSQVLALEEGNLLFEGEKCFAFVANKTGGFDKREIKTGLSDGINIEILSGVKNEDSIKVLQ